MSLRRTSLMAVACCAVATLSHAADPVEQLRSSLRVAAVDNTPDLSSPQNSSADQASSLSQSQVPDDITPAELIAVIREMQRQVSTNTQAISDTSVRTQTLRSQLADIKDQLEKNYSDQLRLLEAQQNVINSVTRTDADGRHILRLDANMADSQEFAQDLNDAVNRARPTHGTLVIRNPLNRNQTVDVNGKPYQIAAGSRTKLTVPVGNVVTRVPDGNVYTWFVGAPDYEMYVKLVDPQRVVTRRPVTESASRPTATASDNVTVLPPATVMQPTEWTTVYDTYYYYPSF